MDRVFLAEAGLLKKYWFWAVREATVQMNMLPVKGGPSTDNNGEFNDLPIDEPIVQANHATSHLDFARLAQPDSPRRRKSTHTKHSSLADKASKLSTPLELFYGVHPDYRVLFRFGSVGYFRRTIESSGQKKSKFSSQSSTAIALGRSDYTNGMMFWDPTTSRFPVSADYKLDPDRQLSDPFPEIHYD